MLRDRLFPYLGLYSGQILPGYNKGTAGTFVLCLQEGEKFVVVENQCPPTGFLRELMGTNGAVQANVHLYGRSGVKAGICRIFQEGTEFPGFTGCRMVGTENCFRRSTRITFQCMEKAKHVISP